MIGIVLAAGLGTRLRPYSSLISKAAMPVAGLPIACRVIEQFRRAGVDGRIVVIARSPEHDIVPLIEADARRNGYEVAFGYQSEQRGSAHALMQVADRRALIARDEHVLIGACDNLYEPDEIAHLVEQHRTSGTDGTMAVLRVPPEKVTVSSSVVVDGDRVVRIVEKPTLDDVASPFCGPLLYAFSPRILGLLDGVQPSPRGELEFQDAMQAFLDAGARVGWFELSRRDTLTLPADLLALNARFFAQTSLPTPGGRDGVTFVPPCLVEDEVAIGAGSTIGPNAHLMRGCRVGADCTIRHALVFPGAEIAKGSTTEHGLVT
ncbi:MAG: NTP transferase domain-containing protein [Verrucomicrobia bacterium]|nr:NTP transferase domain-containing protein [Verrucomicrobiota bacterium]